MAGDQLADATVGRLGKTQSAILCRHLDAVGPEPRETGQNLIWNFPGAVNQLGVDLGLQERRELGQKFIGAGLFLRRNFRDGIDFLWRPAPHEEIGHKTEVIH